MENAVSVAFDAARPRTTDYPHGHSAEVMSFPRPFRTPAERQASVSTLRICAAMEKLQAAIETQKAAVAIWRSSIADAQTSVEALHQSMSLYQTQLADINLRPLKQSSLQLAAMMDRAITVHG